MGHRLKNLCTFVTEMKERGTLLYHILAIAVIIVWGVTFCSTKVLILGGMRPEEIFVVRFLMAYVGLLAISGKKIWTDSWKDELTMMVLGMSGGSIYFMAENSAIEVGLVNNVSFIVCCAPLLTTLLLMTVDKTVRPSKRFHQGSLLAVVGMGIIVFNGEFILKVSPLGDILALSAASCWAVYSVLVRKMDKRYTTLFITRKVFFWGLVTILPVFLFRPWDFPLEGLLRPEMAAHILFLGLVASLLGYVLWNKCLEKAGTLAVSKYIYLNPISTVIASAIILFEPITWVSLVGFVIIILGLSLARIDNQ